MLFKPQNTFIRIRTGYLCSMNIITTLLSNPRGMRSKLNQNSLLRNLHNVVYSIKKQDFLLLLKLGYIFPTSRMKRGYKSCASCWGEVGVHLSWQIGLISFAILTILPTKFISEIIKLLMVTIWVLSTAGGILAQTSSWVHWI